MEMVYYRDYFLFQTVKLERRGVAALFGFGGVLDKNSSHTRNARSSISMADLSNKERESTKVEKKNLFYFKERQISLFSKFLS